MPPAEWRRVGALQCGHPPLEGGGGPARVGQPGGGSSLLRCQQRQADDGAGVPASAGPEWARLQGAWVRVMLLCSLDVDCSSVIG